MINISLTEQERDFLLAAIDTVYSVGVRAEPTPQQSALDGVARSVQLALEIREKLDPKQQDAPAAGKTSVRAAVPPVVPVRTLGSLAQQKTPPQADGVVRYAAADD